MEKRLYSTRFVLDVLSEEPIDTLESLENILYECKEGDLSGKAVQLQSRYLSVEETKDAIQEHGTDEKFFFPEEEDGL